MVPPERSERSPPTYSLRSDLIRRVCFPICIFPFLINFDTIHAITILPFIIPILVQLGCPLHRSFFFLSTIVRSRLKEMQSCTNELVVQIFLPSDGCDRYSTLQYRRPTQMPKMIPSPTVMKSEIR